MTVKKRSFDSLVIGHNRLSQSERHRCDAFGGSEIALRIKIIGTGDTGKRRVKAVFVIAADKFLKDDRHPFLLDVAACGFEVLLRALRERGGVDTFDRVAQLVEANGDVGVVVLHHVRFVDTRERSPVRIFE